MNYINRKNFTEEKNLNNKSIFLNNNPFPHIVIDNFLNEGITEKMSDDFILDDEWINNSFVNNFNKYNLPSLEKKSFECKSIIKELNSESFLKNLEEITSVNGFFLDEELDGAGLTQIFNGGNLNMHTDYISHTVKANWRRVINLIIFFNKDWRETYNGNLEFWNKKEKKMIKSISPISNRCVIFKTDKDSLHGHPKKLNVPAGMSRKSLAVYYYISEEKKLNLMPTKYYHQPGDPFFYKLAIKFDNWLNSIYSYLKRKKLINNKIASKILNLIKFK